MIQTDILMLLITRVLTVGRGKVRKNPVEWRCQYVIVMIEFSNINNGPNRRHWLLMRRNRKHNAPRRSYSYQKCLSQIYIYIGNYQKNPENRTSYKTLA